MYVKELCTCKLTGVFQDCRLRAMLWRQSCFGASLWTSCGLGSGLSPVMF